MLETIEGADTLEGMMKEMLEHAHEHEEHDHHHEHGHGDHDHHHDGRKPAPYAAGIITNMKAMTTRIIMAMTTTIIMTTIMTMGSVAVAMTTIITIMRMRYLPAGGWRLPRFIHRKGSKASLPPWTAVNMERYSARKAWFPRRMAHGSIMTMSPRSMISEAADLR